MNEKITDEKLNMIKDNRSASIMIDGEWVSIGQIVTALLAERAERTKNPGVWDEAPSNAIICEVSYSSNAGSGWNVKNKVIHKRELLKTLAREIAEKYAKRLEHKTPVTIDFFEAAILEYAESIK